MSVEMTYYRVDNGEIVANGKMLDQNHAALQLRDGQAMAKGRYLANEFYFVNGRPRPYSSEERVLLCNRPSPMHSWDVTRRRWRDDRTVDQKQSAIRADVLKQIQAFEAAQPRAMREFALNGDKTRLQEIEDSIAELRIKLG